MGEALCFTASYYWRFRNCNKGIKSASKRDGCKDALQYLEECIERTRIVFLYEGEEACFESEEHQRQISLCSNAQRLDCE